MGALIEDIAILAEAWGVIAEDRGGPARRRSLPPAITWGAPLAEWVAEALPNALLGS